MANYFAAGSDTADVAGPAGRGKLLGFSARESASSAAAASFIIRDGTSTAGPAIAFVELGPDQSINGDWGAIGGIELATGIFIDRTAGTTDITVYY